MLESALPSPDPPPVFHLEPPPTPARRARPAFRVPLGRVVRMPRVARAPRSTSTLEQLDILAWNEEREEQALIGRRGRRVAPVIDPTTIGPNPKRPCIGCPRRATCRAPCEALAYLLPADEIVERREVQSQVLSDPGRQDGGHDAQFVVLHPYFVDDRNNQYGRLTGPDTWPSFVARYRERLRAAICAPRVLTPSQRRVMNMMLGGQDRRDIRLTRSVSRQSIHKIVHAAFKALRRQIGPITESDVDAILEDAQRRFVGDEDPPRGKGRKAASAACVG